MKLIVSAGAISLALVLGGCNQTTGGLTTAAVAGEQSSSQAKKKTAAAKKREACEEAMQAQTNSDLLGGALSMAGGLGGFGGRGGAVAGQVASTAGGMVARSQSAEARQRMMRECN